jgi:hypothetical protein
MQFFRRQCKVGVAMWSATGGLMPVPLLAEVRQTLMPREGVINKIVLDAWDRWWRHPERTLLYSRSRACLIHNYMMLSAPAAFVGDRGIHIIRGQETLFFLADDRLLFRLKKGDENGLSNNIDTQASLAFNDPDQLLIDLPPVARVDITYALNPFATLIDRILVVARDGDRVAWSYTIYPRSDQAEFPATLPIRPIPPAAPDNVVRLPVVKREESGDR